jgi:plasmid stabilization system protein ParE
MLKLRYSAGSKDDLKEIARFIAKDKPLAARQWVEKIREKCRLVLCDALAEALNEFRFANSIALC